MLSVNRVLELLDDATVTAEEAEVLRDACREMAEILYEKFTHEQRASIQAVNKNKHEHHDTQKYTD
jgi:hypothetical protein